MQRGITQLVSILLVLGLVGCSWFGGDEEEVKRDPYPLQRFSSEVELKTIWSTRIGKGSEGDYLRLVPAIDAGRVFAASTDGHVAALDAEKGRKIWQVSIRDAYEDGQANGGFSHRNEQDEAITGGVGVGNGLVLVATSAGHVIAFNQSDGSLAWISDATSEVLAPPQINAHVAVAQAIDGKVTGYDPLDGARRWTYSASVPSLTLRGTSTPVLAANVVIVAFANGRGAILSSEEGITNLEQKVAVGQGQSELERLVDIDGAMVVEGNQLFAASYQGRVIAMDLIKGTLNWQHEASSFAGLGSGFGQVYVASEASVVTAYDMGNGKELWHVDALTYRDITTPVTIGNYIVVGDKEGYIHLLAQTDGRMVGRKKVDNSGIRSTVLTSNDRLYILGNSGKLTAVSIQ